MQVVVTAVQVVAKRLSVRWKLRTRWAVDAPMLTLGTADVASVGRQWCSVGCVTVVRRGTAGRHWLGRHGTVARRARSRWGAFPAAPMYDKIFAT